MILSTNLKNVATILAVCNPCGTEMCSMICRLIIRNVRNVLIFALPRFLECFFFELMAYCE
jgi:hypothetical protein